MRRYSPEATVRSSPEHSCVLSFGVYSVRPCSAMPGVVEGTRTMRGAPLGGRATRAAVEAIPKVNDGKLALDLIRHSRLLTSCYCMCCYSSPTDVDCGFIDDMGH